MLEKSDTNSNSNDATRVRSVDDDALASSATTPSTSQVTISDGIRSLVDTQLEIGSVIKDTFVLVAMLGEGGMGTVYKALNKVWAEVEARDPYVAIKVLKPELSANKQLVRSLYSDFDRTKTLANCPNIIKVHGFDKDGPHVYMTMEYLNGKTLGEYINHEPKSLAQAWFVIEGIGNALAYAHQNNIVHRDIKPGNIFITHDGIVKVLDFGIASKINENEGDETKFGGHELGALTVAYASSEMQKDYPPDARDDIYSFACVIYEILTGQQFFKQKTHKAAQIIGLNNRQMEALNKALAFERSQRISSINELLDKLRPIKTPWMKYLSVSSGVLLITGLVLWRVLTAPPEVKQSGTHQVETAQAVLTPSLLPTPTNTLVPTSEPVQEPTPTVTISTTETASVRDELSYNSTSNDGIVHIHASKSEYKIGESFQVNFTLTQPRYVRVIDRDATGQITILRPNARQPDKLLPADKEQVFPPKGINTPVQGPTGDSTVTIVVSTQPFLKTIEFLNVKGGVSEQIKSGDYSWTQIRYTLHR